ncbi:AI-2E family transporter [uncultured Polaribacter sp.]|uniref:AI-2E family transporter n=1 Tax=uncultured Polaribacter sp. TaxID=174711 RepID=UPI002606399A|nr:AI-2E family transporter [uncultured Polaribacter sp.]
MTSKTIANGILRALGILLGIFLLGYFLYAIQSVIVYVIIAGILSLIARPIILFLRRKLKFPNTIAVVATMVLMLSFLTGLILLFIPLIIEQGENLSLLQGNELQADIRNIFHRITLYFSSKGIDIDVLAELKNINFISQFKQIPNFLNAVLGMLGAISVGIFSVLFISFFFMKDRKLLKSAFMVFVPEGTESRFSKSLETINTLLSKYFIGLIFQISILFVLYTIILLIFGIKNAVVIAFLCALLNLIPYIGPLIGAVIMFVLSMTSNIELDFQTQILPRTFYVMMGYLIAQLIDNFGSQPIIFSRTTKSHPLEIFLVIIIGGLLFGIVGMITAVPMYTALKVILKEFLSENKIVKSLTKDL